MAIEMAKGVRDFPPEEKILREEVVTKLKLVFEQYGFSPLETPSIERLDTLTAKFAAGEESDTAKEIFKLSDQGNRDLGLRFDLTVPLSRFVALNPNVKLPFKRYEIGRVFRDGPIKLGRYREFWQCDVDTIGVASVKAEAEILLLALDVFKSLKFDAYLEINNRKLLFELMDYCGVAKEQQETVIISIDKLKKLGNVAVQAELEDKDISSVAIEKLLAIFSVTGTNQDIIEELKQYVPESAGLKEIEELLHYLKFVEQGKIIINPALARGLNYYTGIVFEGFLRESKITSSICGGGRYDGMIGMFAQNNRQYPAVGIAFGLEPITDAMKLMNMGMKKTVTTLYLIPIKTFPETLLIANTLRSAGINVDIDCMDRSISKNMDFANTMGIPFVGFLGDTELAQEKIKIKNMHSGEEIYVTLQEAYELLKDA